MRPGMYIHLKPGLADIDLTVHWVVDMRSLHEEDDIKNLALPSPYKLTR